MRYRAVIFCFVLAVAACGELQPETTPKSGSNNGDTSNGGSTNNGGTNNGGANNGGPDTWQTLGTIGASNMGSNSPAGFALCAPADVRQDDLSFASHATTVPSGEWPDVEPGEQGKCGDDFETFAWRLANCERITKGLEPLKCDLRMVWVSRQHNADMIARDFFAHDNPDGETPFDRFTERGIQYGPAAENIAAKQSVEEAHYGWMDSSGHRANILGDYEYAGVGTASTQGSILLTTGFYSPQ